MLYEGATVCISCARVALSPMRAALRYTAKVAARECRGKKAEKRPDTPTTPPPTASEIAELSIPHGRHGRDGLPGGEADM